MRKTRMSKAKVKKLWKKQSTEPALRDYESSLEVSQLLSWYNINHTVDKSIVWVYEYLKNMGHPTEFIDRVKLIKPYNIGMTYCSLARIHNNGSNIGTYYADKILARIRLHIPDEIPMKEEKLSVYQHTINKTKETSDLLIADLEEELDKCPDVSLNVYDFLKAKAITKATANAIVAFYEPILIEYDNALQGNIEEGYSDKKMLEAKFFLVASFIENAELAASNVKTINRKPRKAREKKLKKINLTQLKYCVSHDPLKLVSIEPGSIVGASSLWIYNHKYRILGCYHAADETGLSIKGTSILNYNPETSKSKKLRKPEDVLAEVATTGKIILRKLLDKIKTTEATLSGRINVDTILLRVIK